MISLNGTWDMSICDNGDVLNISPCRIDDIRRLGGKVITATVPGNYELDLEQNGIIGDPYFGKNSIEGRNRESLHIFYSKIFTLDLSPNSSNNDAQYYIIFNGIDTLSKVYLNGKLILETNNMFVPFRAEVSGNDFHEGKNEIFVHIYPIEKESRKHDYPMYLSAGKYNMDSLYVRKAAYMYGWDIFPRFLTAGIWKDVNIVKKEKYSFLQSYLYTVSLSSDLKRCKLNLFYEIEVNDEPYSRFCVKIEGDCKNSHFEKAEQVWSKAGHVEILLENPELWWPRRCGEQNLYNITISLLKEDKVICKKEFTFGIRTIHLIRTSTLDSSGKGEFVFCINGRNIFILGTNWVPLDSFPSQSHKKMRKALELVEDINCNMIRCWGGGYWEEDEFYNECDRLGILVWQDFMQACGRYPESDEYIENYKREILYEIRRLRQHTCLALWAGDNENDTACTYNEGKVLDPNTNRTTRYIIPNLLRMNDYVRDYIASSPYIDNIAFGEGTERNYKEIDENLPERHLWGPRDYYKGIFYSAAKACFASEIGYHGCPSITTIKKFISKDALWPYQNNEEWILHASSPTCDEESLYAYRIPLMANQIKVLFGKEAKSLEEFALLSQISQAEAIKFFIERFRCHKWNNKTGIIWWNILDGCPQFSDAVVDYYFNKKLAYEYIKRSQQMILIACDEPDANDNVNLVAVNDYMDDIPIHYFVRDLVANQIVSEGDYLMAGNCSQVICQVPTNKRKAFFLMNWSDGTNTFTNHYVTWNVPFNNNDYLKYAKEAELISGD